MKNYKNIIVTGSVAFDDIMDFPAKFSDFLQPDKLHQINVSFVVEKLEKQLGGTGTNISYNLSLLTNTPLSLLAGVGRDAKDFLDFLHLHNISTDGILVDKELYTATGKVITDIKNNQIWGFYYGACAKGKDIPLNQFATKDSLVVISANHPEAFIHFQKESIEMGLDYLYDPGMGLTWIKKDDLLNGIEHCKWLVGNDYEISQILKMLNVDLNYFLQKNIAVITTLGEKGVKYQDNTTVLEIPAYKVEHAKDPTGAGDAWRAGFLAGVVGQKSLENSLIHGNVMASFAVEHYGTVNHKPKREEIEERVASL
jgi:adenosine kinase